MNNTKICLLLFCFFIANFYLFSQEVDYPDVLVHLNDVSKQPIKGKLLMLDNGIYYIQTSDGKLSLKKEEIKRIEFIEKKKEDVLKTSKEKVKSQESLPEEILPEGDIIKFAVTKGVSEENANRVYKEIGLLGFTGKDKDKLFFNMVKVYQDDVPLEESLSALKKLKDLELGIDFEDVYIYTLDAMRIGINLENCLKIISVLRRENISGNELTKLFSSITNLVQEGHTLDECINVIIALKRIKSESSETPVYFNLLFSQAKEGLSLDEGLNALNFLKKLGLSQREIEDSFIFFNRLKQEGASLIDMESAFAELSSREYINQDREKLLELIIDARKKGVPLSKSYVILSETEDQKLSKQETIKIFEEKIQKEIEEVGRLKQDREDYLR